MDTDTTSPLLEDEALDSYETWEPVFDFSSSEYDLDKVAAHIAKINKRAQDKGLEGGITTSLSTQVEKDDQGHDIQVEVLHVEYTTIKANGWTLVAAVTWVGDKPVVNTVPGYAGPLVDRSTLDGHCDHCQASRVRNHVIVCEHPEHGRQVVGGQCVKDLLGHAWNIVFLPGTMGRGDLVGFRSPQPQVSYRVLDIVVAAIAATRTWGWVSAANSEAWDKARTSSWVLPLVTLGPAGMIAQERKQKRPDYNYISEVEAAAAIIEDPATEVEAQAVIAWAQGLDESRSEFNANLVALTSSEFVDVNGKGRVGVLSYAPTGYARHLETAAEREAKQAAREAAKAQVNNTPLGQPKDKVTFEATITGVKFIEGDYGTTTLVKFFTTTNQKVAWFASNTEIDETWIGTQVEVKATVKGTSEFRDETETRILRAKVTKVGGEAPRPKPSMVPGPPVPAPPAWMN